MKTYNHRTSLSEADTLAAVRHLNWRRVTVTLVRLEKYLSIGVETVKLQMRDLVCKGLVEHDQHKRSDYHAVKMSPPPYNMPVGKKKTRRNNQQLATCPEDFGYEG